MTGYIALVHKDEGTSYGVSFPDVPGCISAGDTFSEAIENAGEALAGHLSLMRADGEPIPTPRSLEALRQSDEFLEDAKGAVVAFVTPRAEQASVIRPDVSAVIREIAYEPSNEELIVTFVSGRIYLYSGVSAATFDEFVKAPSKGHYFNAHIRDAHPYREVSERVLVAAE
jgi:predicted RNase H-like HicB family nuclease